MAYGERKYSAEDILRLIRTKKDAFWSRERERRPLALFHEAARRVPAYKDFLRKHKIQPAKIKTFKDFQSVPPVSKKNYLRQYPLEKLCWDGTLKRPLVFTSTSGSTGEPFYFPRGEQLDWQSAIYHQLFLDYGKSSKNKSTLVIVGFGMGVWIGGLITYQAFKIISLQGYPLTILTPGSNRKEIFEALKNIGKKFDQIILCGYPPFVKDILDEGAAFGIRWKKFKIRIVFAAEQFSERFRTYVARKAGIKNVYLDTMNIYGSADLGTMAEETPFSILARHFALRDTKIYKNLFGAAHRTPTFAQFNPLFINFEVLNKSVLCTGNSILPLIRYDIGDHGGVLGFKEVVGMFKKDQINILARARQFGLGHTITEMPFVYVYERSDLSTKLYGAIIYPEHIREAVQHSSLHRFLTGKLTMLTKNDRRENEYLEINLELKPKTNPPRHFKNRVHDLIVGALKKKNAEYKYLFSLMPDRVSPRILFWKHQHPLHFQPDIKQKWVKKT